MSSNKNFNNNTKKDTRKKEEKRKAYQENKGNWEFNFFQKKYDPNLEGSIKMSMRPSNGFNPKDVHQYITPEVSKEEQILAKKSRGEHLKTSEQIILTNYLDRKAEMVANDIKAIKTQGLAAKPTTKEGRTRLLLHTLETQLQRNNKDLIANIFLRLMEDDFEITPVIAQDYAKQISQMNTVVSSLDLIELQFTKFHSQMPPLNTRGFKKFDDWQIQVIKNIDDNISTIINAPTSAGKSVLSGYATTKGKVLFVVPTDALAWQMSAYIGNILGTNIPILTATYQTNPTRDEMIDILNKAPAITGTADTIVDFLPFIKNEFKWLIFDEVHMIGKPEGCAMEHIIKMVPNVPILALSATIGNTDDLSEWFSQFLPGNKVTKVICDKRFFNLQRFYYDQTNDSLTCLHPLALIEEEQIADRSVLLKQLQPTPPNAWDLATRIQQKMDLSSLAPHEYFSGSKRIELDDANVYFNKLLEFLVDRYQTDPRTVMEIVNSYKHESLVSEATDLVKLVFKLKAEDKTPAIIFQKNTIACLRMAREFAKDLDKLESEKNPKLIADRIRQHKMARRMDKHVEVSGGQSSGEKNKYNRKEMKQMMGTLAKKKDKYGESTVPTAVLSTVETTAIQEPHPDFNLNNNQYFSEGIVDGWVRDLKKYFPNTGDYYHFMIKLLWRGVGVYAKGLPDPYLRLVQTLACQKQLAVVFSDQSLVFGISMPFRTVVIIRDNKQEDDLEPMMFHQMSGRAGRRGLDKEGNVVFAGYSWSRIKELSISEPPIVTGTSNVLYTIPHANRLSEIAKTGQNWDNTCRAFLDSSISEEDSLEFLEGIKTNYDGGWSFGIVADNTNHLHMNWKFRSSDECLLASFLVPYLRRGFEGKDHTQEANQVELAHFLCRFLSVKETDNPEFALEEPVILSEHPYNQILEQLLDLQIELPEMIDNRLFKSIQLNSIVKSVSEDETDELRHRLLEFGEKIKNIQHFCFHSKIIGLSKLMGKLLTRIWWIYHTSSPIMKSFHVYEFEEFLSVDQINADRADVADEDDEEEYESSSESEFGDTGSDTS